MFIDKVDIHIQAGNGGNGSVSFRREKYVARGGPDGGDGGKGGNVIFSVADGENTLLMFRYHRKFIAQNGENGSAKKFHGKNGDNIVLKVPRGTVLRDKESGKVIHDMSDGNDFIAARGGNGGWGNTHFATPTRQVPIFAKSGREGEVRDITLELKMLADVGLVGYPNVGKSTLLSCVSAAKPKIANYHFTTLSPNLGVVSQYGETFVMADIPGLIEGASEGAGLGHEFLRHVDRCRLLVHVFDLSASERPDPLEDIKAINTELRKYDKALGKRPQILVGNKIDEGYDEAVLKKIKAYAARRKEPIFLISGVIGEGVEELMRTICEKLRALPPLATYEREYFDEKPQIVREGCEIAVEDGVYCVTGEWLRILCNDINFDDRESLSYFQKALRDGGVIDKLEQAGIRENDVVDIYGIQFNFVF